MKTFIVLGLGFGDEGKGLTSEYICRYKAKNPTVVRFNGGHQAGHTVWKDGKKHTFSNFGSGTLVGASTYWSRYCTIDPVGIANERENLSVFFGINPKILVDGLCPVTTSLDKAYNQFMEMIRDIGKHGSVGVGFGATIHRNESTPYKLYAKDLLHSYVVEQKMRSIYLYYMNLIESQYGKKGWYKFTKLVDNIQSGGNDFEMKLSEIFHHKTLEIVNEENIFSITNPVDFVFEGAQGILLDMDHGFFPHVTRSNTTSKNALKLCKKYSLPHPEIFYVTRAYQTRHGAGPMTNEDISIEDKIYMNPNETNITGDWQGEFRRTVLDVDLLKYAVESDNVYSSGLKKNLVFTCTDHMVDTYFTRKGMLFNQFDYNDIKNLILPDARLFISKSPYSEKLEKIAEKKLEKSA